jgi:hypothetical protein
MTVTVFAWYPVTMQRHDGRTTLLANRAFYDDAAREVTVEDDYSGHEYSVDQLFSLDENEFRFATETGERIVLRATIPEDAAASDRFSLGIPLPVEIIGAIMSNTIREPTISAAVDDDGDVHTMILETGVGLYARYSRTWILMTDISPIEQLDIVDVPATDLEHYDMADDQGKTISIRDLSPITQPGQLAVGPSRTETLTASSTPGMILVSSAADLPDAIAYAATDAGAGARWYVTRRAKALGWEEALPWE